MTSILRVLIWVWLAMASGPLWAQANPFAPGWNMDPEASELRFQSIKKGSVIELSTFTSMTGSITETGEANVNILLDSIDTKLDLRNVRMRFLFFETFQHPVASLSMKLTPQMLDGLAEKRRITRRMPYTLTMRGNSWEFEAEMVLTLMSDDHVAVSPAEPIVMSVEQLGLLEGLQKLQDAANVDIVPATVVTFDFVFRRAGTENADRPPATQGEAVVSAGGLVPVQSTASAQSSAAPPPAIPARAALEPEGDFSREACVGRFEILSRSGNIFFAPTSSEIQDDSLPLLNTVVDIIQRCPNLSVQVAGHTDSRGSSQFNQRLSERRAESVADFLLSRGIAEGRIEWIGFGENRPIASNATFRGRAQNRRIEFIPQSG